MAEAKCVFCKIAQGGIPVRRVAEMPDALAFLDAGPLAPGHTLLIPKRHYESVLDVPGDVLGSLLSCLPGLAGAIVRASGASGVNVLQNTGQSAGQVVPHLHFHIIPRREGDGLGFRWRSGVYGSGEAEAMAASIIRELRD